MPYTPSQPRGSHYFAAMCFSLSGLVMGALLAGSIAISAALFGALLAGGVLGFYLSQGSK